MKKPSLYFFVLLVAVLIIVGYFYFKEKAPSSTGTDQPDVSLVDTVVPTPDAPLSPSDTVSPPAMFVDPINDALSRMTKKKFGTKVSPADSPVSNERFTGFHTGVDFEVLNDDELNQEIPIRAVCQGPIRQKNWVSGYGGLVVQECQREGKPISIIYGHLDLASVSSKVGEVVMQSAHLGNLGAEYSSETDGERKHLHLGFYNGTPASIRGYVGNKEGLAPWIDPCIYICK